MKILQVHNIYQGKTGEETVVEEERRILTQRGHKVIQFIKDNSNLKGFKPLDKLKMLLSLTASKQIEREFTELLKREEPDICHVHNTFPIITPVIYGVCNEQRVPVVQTLHNYKMVCTNSLMFREGEVCELCLNKNLYTSIKYKCYRNSYFATAAQAHVIQHHRKIGTWNERIDRYVCLTEFHKDKLVSGGLPREKTLVKPNFIAESGLSVSQEDFFLFVGKIDDYKGLQDLLHLFRNNATSQFVLIGKSESPAMFDEFKNVEYLGENGREIVLEYMRRCKAVIFPSKYYEGMPMVILEAFSHQKPVISRNVGAMSSMVINKHNGVHYANVDELVDTIQLLEQDSQLVRELGKNAYAEYKDKYSEERGYKNLLDLYTSVLNSQ